MYQNSPFYSTSSNVYNESFKNFAPTSILGQNVIVSQEQERRISDVLNTAIIGVEPSACFAQNIPIQAAQKRIVPGGVIFSFPAESPNQQQFCPCHPISTQPRSSEIVQSGSPSALEQQRALDAIQKGGLEFMQYQEHLHKHPFQLKFHYDVSTSCTDLSSLFYRTQQTKDDTKEYRKVAFAMEDKYVQMTTECICGFKKCEKEKRRQLKKNSKGTKNKQSGRIYSSEDELYNSNQSESERSELD
ncbi:uncharacterized protein LOC132706694 [Cylas formicarius]|uniref:uncharacterized protein LOC132706694 n=1 Tax=Cylas formicarius TaxID=197179 RepID=UPI002958888A|nr:uncharacterized protein LOC132706694 [Cylas formicarius]